MSGFSFYLLSLATPLFLLVFLCALLTGVKKKRFMASSYAKATEYNYWQVMSDKGLAGEYALGRAIERFSPEEQLFFNLYIPKASQGTSEVDAVLVQPWGIVVFENKNYSGRIFGKGDDRTWTQVLNRNSKFVFPNPIKQNQGHIDALSAYLDLPDNVFIPVIVFADKTNIEHVNSQDLAYVFLTSEITGWLTRMAQSERRLSDEQCELARARLTPCTKASNEVKQAHINQINSRRRTASRRTPATTTNQERSNANASATLTPKVESIPTSSYAISSQIPSESSEATTTMSTMDVLEKLTPVISVQSMEAHVTIPRCPRCGVRMVRRKVHKGERKGKEMWGCPNYPRCHSVIDID